jgi:hypothetical protein
MYLIVSYSFSISLNSSFSFLKFILQQLHQDNENAMHESTTVITLPIQNTTKINHFDFFGFFFTLFVAAVNKPADSWY